MVILIVLLFRVFFRIDNVKIHCFFFVVAHGVKRKGGHGGSGGSSNKDNTKTPVLNPVGKSPISFLQVKNSTSFFFVSENKKKKELK